MLLGRGWVALGEWSGLLAGSASLWKPWIFSRGLNNTVPSLPPSDPRVSLQVSLPSAQQSGWDAGLVYLYGLPGYRAAGLGHFPSICGGIARLDTGHAQSTAVQVGDRRAVQVTGEQCRWVLTEPFR